MPKVFTVLNDETNIVKNCMMMIEILFSNDKCHGMGHARGDGHGHGFNLDSWHLRDLEKRKKNYHVYDGGC